MTRRPLRGFDPAALTRARREAGYTRSELGRLSEHSRGAITVWESGEGAPSVEGLKRVLAALGQSYADLVTLTPGEMYLGDLRVRAGYTQAQFAARLGFSVTKLAYLERGESPMSDETAGVIAVELGLDKNEVLAAHQRVRTRPPNTPA